LELSFAEYFLARGESAGDTPRLIGRVFWVNDSGTEFDLINIPIAKINGGEDDVDKGYSFHKRTADIPVPCNVSSVYVQFEFSVTDIGEHPMGSWMPCSCGHYPGIPAARILRGWLNMHNCNFFKVPL
jgi:hypothetical protein